MNVDRMRRQAARLDDLGLVVNGQPNGRTSGDLIGLDAAAFFAKVNARSEVVRDAWAEVFRTFASDDVEWIDTPAHGHVWRVQAFYPAGQGAFYPAGRYCVTCGVVSTTP